MIHSSYLSMLTRVGLRVAAEPETEQISLAQAYLHLRMDAEGSPPTHPEDNWLTDNITAAREWCEGYCGHALAPQILELSLGQFGRWGGPYSYLPYRPIYNFEAGVLPNSPIVLPMSPVAGIESIIYIDGDGATQTLSVGAYTLDNRSMPNLLYPAFGVNWPTTRAVPNAVIVRYHAGYTLTGDSPNDYPLPKRYRAAMMLVLGHLYENRENTMVQYSIAEIPMGAAALMERGRLRLSMS